MGGERGKQRGPDGLGGPREGGEIVRIEQGLTRSIRLNHLA